jgi:hypothetical protein
MPEADMAAPWVYEHCVTCGRRTRHRFDGDGAGADFSRVVCDECGNSTTVGPKDDEYIVTITNMAGPSLRASEYYLAMHVNAASEAEALARGLRHARQVNGRAGMPPHGIRVGEAELQRQAKVMPAKDAEPGAAST